MIKRIGLLTSGGDCQALNATMRGVVKGLTNSIDDLEVYGFDDGYKGLIYGKYRMLTSKDFSGILTQGGTILGTSRQPFMRTMGCARNVDGDKSVARVVPGKEVVAWLGNRRVETIRCLFLCG